MLAVALGMCIAGHAHAQSAVGSIFGHAPQGDTVRIENIDTGTERELVVGDSGRYSFGQLPPGRYRVTSGDNTRDVVVNVGTGTETSFTADATLDTIEVTAGQINPIDVSSVESTTVFTADQLQAMPVARDISSVALLAPGTVRGDAAFGNLASFGGSSVAENGYYINGFDVTNIRNFVSFAELPFDAIAEQQVKTGGYGAEFGRSLGGVISLVTKRGTNEWTGGVSAYWSPSGLAASDRNVYSRDADAIAGGQHLYRYLSANKAEESSLNVYAGGPLVQDKLFVFGLLEGVSNTYDTYETFDSEKQRDTTPRGLVKLDWNITDDHLLEFTGIRNEADTTITHYASDSLYANTHDDVIDRYKERTGGEVGVAKYTGYLSDSFTLSVMGGMLKNHDAYRTTPADGTDCPAVFDGRDGGELVYMGCWNESAFTVRDTEFGPDLDRRRAFRIDGDWSIGDHLLRFGYDSETFSSGSAGTTYSGGEYYRYYTAGSSGAVNGVEVAPGTDYVRHRTLTTSSATYDVINKAAYIEDNWQVNDRLMVYGGVRAERYENRNSDDVAFVKTDNLWAPRLGFSYDVNGDSSLKIFGNAGRYFIPIAANTNVRASGVEQLRDTYYLFDDIDPETGVPTGLGQQLGQVQVNGSATPPDPRTVSARNLKPMYQDEFILGAQMALGNDWSVGVRGIAREVRNGMDDYCGKQAFADWAEDNGYEDFDTHSMATCVIVNPGQDLQIALDVNNDGNYEYHTVSNDYLDLPEYKRKYRALEFFWERAYADGWSLQGSYTWAKSDGNMEGYVNSTLEQDDAGLTQDFDHALFTHGTDGYLPNDRRHTLKVFGRYDLSEEWSVGGVGIVQSGAPVNCNGYIPLEGLGEDEGPLQSYGPSSFYCLDADGEQTLTQRGSRGRTPWTMTIDTSLSYQPNWADKRLTLKMDVFNLLNSQKVTKFNQTADRNRASPEFDPEFLNAYSFQAPRSVRLSAHYAF